MSSILSTLLIKLGADSSELTAEFEKAAKDSKRWAAASEADALKAAAGFAKAGAAVATAAAVGFTALINKSVQASDALLESAEKLGITNKALVGLRLAGAAAGVETGKLEAAMVRMSKQISEAAMGAGAAQDELRELGLNAAALEQLTVDEQMKVVADRLAGVADQSDRARIQIALFGREGAAFTAMLSKGAKGLEDAEKAAVEMGLALNSIQANNVNEAAAASDVLSASFEGLTRQLGAAFAPALQAGAEWLSTFITNITSALPQITAFAFELAGVNREILRMTSLEINAEIDTVYQALTAAQANLRRELDGLPASLAATSPTIKALQDQVEALGQRYVDLTRRREELARTPEIENPVATKAPDSVIPSVTFDVAAYEAGLAQMADLRLKSVLSVNEAEKQFDADLRSEILANRQVSDEKLLELSKNLAAARVKAEMDAERTAREASGVPMNEQEQLAAHQEMLKRMSEETIKILQETKSREAQIIKDAYASQPIDPTAYKASLEEQAVLRLQNIEATAAAEKMIEDRLRAEILEGRRVSETELLELAKSFAAAKVQAEAEAEMAAREALNLPMTGEEQIEYQKELYRRMGEETNKILQESKAKEKQIVTETEREILNAQKTRISGTRDFFNQINSLSASGSKKGYLIAKAAAIAEAALNIPKAASDAYAWGVKIGGPPAGAAAAAVAVTAQLANLASVRSGGGYASAGGAVETAPGGYTPASPMMGETTENDRAPARSAVNITITGNMGWDEYIQSKVIAGIKEAVNERDVVVISPGSRNGRDLVAYA